MINEFIFFAHLFGSDAEQEVNRVFCETQEQAWNKAQKRRNAVLTIKKNIMKRALKLSKLKIMAPAEEEALDLCQQMALTTCFSNCNNGMSLPLEIAKECALIAIDLIIKFSIPLKCTVNEDIYLQDVKAEIEKLQTITDEEKYN